MNFLLAAVIASGRQKATLPAVTAGLVASLAVNLWLMGNLGLPAAAMAAICSSAVVAVICATLLGRGTLTRLLLPFLLGALPVPGILLLMRFTGLTWPLLVLSGLLLAMPSVLLWASSRRGWNRLRMTLS